jgi:hypothetical protein
VQNITPWVITHVNCAHSGDIDLERLGDRLGRDHSYLRADLAGNRIDELLPLNYLADE